MYIVINHNTRVATRCVNDFHFSIVRGYGTEECWDVIFYPHFFFKITSNKDTERMGLRLKVIPSAGLDHHTTAGFLARQIKFNANDHNLIYTTAKLSANIDN